MHQGFNLKKERNKESKVLRKAFYLHDSKLSLSDNHEEDTCVLTRREVKLTVVTCERAIPFYGRHEATPHLIGSTVFPLILAA